VVHVYFSQDANGTGLFEIDLTTGTAVLVGAGITGVTSTTCGLTETPNPFVLLASQPGAIANVAADGSGAAPIAGSAVSEALAMNIATGALFSQLNGVFIGLQPVTGVSTGALAAPGFDLEGLAADPNTNVLYGIGGDTNLHRYNIATNSWSIVGNTTIAFDNCGLCFDHVNGVLYAVDPGTDLFYRINPNNGATVVVGPLGTNGAGGLAFVVE
jgi:hypothetical protein